MKPSTQIDYRARIDEVLVWLAAHQNEAVSPARLARVAHFSPYHFHQVFRGVCGESVMQCLRRPRLESAALRLRRTGDGVTQVALDAGFESHEGFTRAFKEHFGAPPNVWRKQESPRMRRLGRRGPLGLPEVEVRRSKPVSFVCARHRGAFDAVPAAWEKLVAAVSRQGLYTGREQLVGRYPDDPEVTPPGKLRFDIGLVPLQALPARRPHGLACGTRPCPTGSGRWPCIAGATPP